MDHTTFDTLMRQVARQTTRRAALATLLGGVLLLNDPAASEATKEAERRKDRRRKQRRRQKASGSALKPISIRVHNPGRNYVTVQHGFVRTASNLRLQCVEINRITIPPGGLRHFQSPRSSEYLWINDTYWIDFNNVYLGPPEVSAAVNGTPLPFTLNCPRRGTTILWTKPMVVHQTVTITMLGKVFSATRNRDTNYKELTVTLPATL